MEQKQIKGTKDILPIIAKNYNYIIFGVLLLQLNIVVFQLFFSKSSLVLNTILASASIFSILMFKDLKGIEDNHVPFKFRTAVLLSLLSLFNHIALNLLDMITKSAGNKSFFGILIFLDVTTVIGFIGLIFQEGISELFESLESQNYTENLTNDDNEAIKPGDAIIGYEVKINKKKENDKGKKTTKPIILPIHDRFLHMLILGPTGSGKTSQSIIPMINRDMTNKEMGIIVLEPKGDLAEKVYAMGKIYDRNVLYFNPLLPDCPYFNPLHGKESDVIENMATTFNMLNPDAPQFFKDMTDGLIRRGVKLLKRLYDNDATLIDLNTLVWDANGEGRKIVTSFSRIKNPNPDVQKENEELVSWFLNDYYSGMSGARGGTKTYEHCSGVRSQISKLISNKYLRKVLNPPKGVQSDIDFDKALEDGMVVSITTAQGAFRELGRFLGYFVILQLQASVFRRPGNEDTRRHCMLYIDEFQVYSNPGFGDMLTMGRSYRVASHLATQARAQIGMGSGKDGRAFIDLVSTNARNKIIYPGVSFADAKYYSDEFGETLNIVKGKTYGKKRFLSSLDDERVSTSVKEEMENRFSPSDIIYRPFKQITYCLIKNNNVTTPGISEINFIPKDINSQINKMVEEYNEEQFKKDREAEELLKTAFSTNTFDAKVKMEDAIIKPITVTKPMAPETQKTIEISDDEDEVFSYQEDDGFDEEIISETKKENPKKEFTKPIVTPKKDIFENMEDIEEDDLI